jgi:ABC-type spermidine/putrescine transport system permease subunit II
VTVRSRGALAITIAALLFLYVPLAVVVLFSFHKTGSLSLPFTGFSLRWYRFVLSDPGFRSALENSLFVAAWTSVITLLLGTLASFGIARTRSRLRGPLALLFFLPITLPGLFIGLSMLVFFVRVNIDLSLTTVIIAHSVYVFPYFLLIAIAALERLDPALEEAAADLGANGWLRFWRVTMPQIWPLLVGATCLAFALSFDEFVITFFVIGPDGTLPLYIWSQLRRTVDPSINVVSTLLMTVTLVLWLVAFLFALRAARRKAASGDDLVAEVVPL